MITAILGYRSKRFADLFADIQRDEDNFCDPGQLREFVKGVRSTATAFVGLCPQSADETLLFKFSDGSFLEISNPNQECFLPASILVTFPGCTADLLHARNKDYFK